MVVGWGGWPVQRKRATSTPALLLQVDDTKEDKHSDVQLDLLSISRLFFSRFSILNVGSVLSKSFWFDSADSFLFLDGSVFDWKVVRVLMVVGLSSPLSKSSFIYFILGVLMMMITDLVPPSASLPASPYPLS